MLRLAGDHLFGKLLFTWLSLVMSMMGSFCAVLFLRFLRVFLPTPLNLLHYVSDFRRKLLTACEAAKSNLKSTQGKMKYNYDKNTKERSKTV